MTTELIKVKSKKSDKIVLITEDMFDKEKHVRIGGEPAGKPEITTDGDGDGKPDGEVNFAKMTVPQMKSFAGQYGIDLGDASSKAEITAKLEAWKEAQATDNGEG